MARASVAAVAKIGGEPCQVTIWSLRDTKMPEIIGSLSIARMKYAAALRTKYIAPAVAQAVELLTHQRRRAGSQ